MVTVLSWWVYVVAVPLAYWLAPAAVRNWVIPLTSAAFLAYYAPIDVGVMVLLALAVYASFEIDSARVSVVRTPAVILMVFGYLFYSKYLPAFAAAISEAASLGQFAIPIGVSYFSFKLIHYAIERGRGNFPAHSLSDFANFMFLMPIFSAGPIERFEHFLAERRLAFDASFLVEGSTRIIHGLVKKFVVCVLLAEAIQRVTGGNGLTLIDRLETANPAEVWAFLFLSLLYTYFDFSAYTDIAIGASRLLGLRIMENFNYPLLATSLRDFWLRWHMTLATWCRSYIYMGMIGWTRNPYLAVIATFVVMGAWHAGWPLNWIIWGIWHGTGMVVVLVWSRFAQKRRITFFKTRAGSVAGWALTLVFVTLGGAFTALHAVAPVQESFRLIAKAFGMTLYL